MTQNIIVNLSPKTRGFHIVTNQIISQCDFMAKANGLINFLLLHTSASLSINENADASVRSDCLRYFNKMVPEGDGYKHSLEGDDDMPAHIKSMLLGVSLTIPIHKGKLVLGTWQGIYLGEHRNNAGGRRIAVTLITSASTTEA